MTVLAAVQHIIDFPFLHNDCKNTIFLLIGQKKANLFVRLQRNSYLCTHENSLFTTICHLLRLFSLAVEDSLCIVDHALPVAALCGSISSESGSQKFINFFP